MGFTVFIASQKGGTRKSTIARPLNVAFTLAGWQTKIIDMDGNQATAWSWNERRKANGILPALIVEKHLHASGAIQAREGYDMVIIDGKGYASKETTDVALVSDLILIPSGTGLDDLEPAVDLALGLVQKHGIDPSRILFPLTNLGKSVADLVEARDYLAQAGFQASPGDISIMSCYHQAHTAGRAITEVSSPSPKKKANDWIRGIIDRIEQLNA
jgi:chromosome partitioning protein